MTNAPPVNVVTLGITAFGSVTDAFAAFRAQIDPVVWNLVPHLPEFLTCYGWALRPASWSAYVRSLLSMREPSPDLTLVQIPESGWLDLFTDGSCHGPRVPWRLASWAVVMADPHDIGLMGQGSVVPNASPLKGLTQTAFRAEVRAALEALRIGAMLKCKVRIWCDCQGVVERVTALSQGLKRTKRNGKHADLWRESEALLPEFGPCGLTITKVAAHQDASAPISAVDTWCFVQS